MTPIEDYFSAIFVLTLERRKDRQDKMDELLTELGIRKPRWFFGYDKPLDHAGKPNGNKGCTESHRSILEAIINSGLRRVLVLEDDIEIAYTDPEMKARVDPQKLFADHINEVPGDWDMLYLGGQYGSYPDRRISPHVIKFNSMLTTSSYAITNKMARTMAPYISGVGPIDSLYSGFHPKHKCYIFQPRLFIQGRSLSDLTDREDDNRHCMLDQAHEEMMLAGVWRKTLGGGNILDSEIFRREIAAPNDMDGTDVIVDGEVYVVESLRLPKHPAPWRRGESCSYQLVKKECSP
jgi:GR25 family glycosyltransferase involved in LPS biosynthesis